MAGTHLCRTCRAMLTDADAARSPGKCPYCGAEFAAETSSVNPFAPPKFGPDEDFSVPLLNSEIPPTFPGKIVFALRLFLENFVLISALILTIWVPGNLLIGLVTWNNADVELNEPTQVAKLTNLVEGVFGPIYVAGILYLLANRMTGQSSSYLEALRVGLHNWWRLFGARFVAGLFILGGLIALIVPGVILALRYMLLDSVVVLEGAGAAQARKRSTQLVQGKELQLLVWGILYFCGVLTLTMCMMALVEFVPALDNIWCVTLLRCLTDILNSFSVVFLFVYYWEAQLRRPALLEADRDIDLAKKHGGDDPLFRRHDS